MNNKWTWLKEYMQKNNISQGEVADALQWQKTRVSELLGGKRDFPVNKVFPAARFFNLDLEEFTKYNSGFSREIPSTDGKQPQKQATADLVKIDIVNPSGGEKEPVFRPRQHKSNDCPRRCHAADHQRRRPDLGRRFHQNPYFGRPLPVCAERRSLCQKAAAGQFQPLGRHYLRQPALSADRHQQTGQTLHPRQSHIRHQNLPLIPFRRRQGLLCKKNAKTESLRVFYRIKSYSAVLFPFSLFSPAGREEA